MTDHGQPSSGLDISALKKLARSANAASARLSDMADSARDLFVEAAATASRLRLGEDAPPPSWDVEREAFIRRLERDL